MRAPAACLLALAALAAPASASAGRFAVGLARGADPAAVAARVARATGGTVSPLTPFALVVTAPSAAAAERQRGVAFVERLERSRRLAFVPNDPLAKRQWYLGAVRAFETWPLWPLRPLLSPVRVAVIDSGIDGSHPEFEGRIADWRSFVDAFPRRDSLGHGTFVAGVIAATLNNSMGIAGIAFPARLLVAKVVRADGTISPEDEAQAIRWAVDSGADVINLSIAALRDPTDRRNDSYSALEARAVEYAVRNGVVVVAAVGNGDGAPRMPWSHASYPAALPHVLGVGAVARDGSVPEFSNRDPVYTDLVAPGDEIVSTVPRSAPGEKIACADDGYSSSICAPDEFRRGQGTSFAAAQVSAAAALVLATRPSLAPEQVQSVLERSATDGEPANGCKRCYTGRDDVSGWGSLDVAAALRALSGPLPLTDDLEPNDDAGWHAATISGTAREVEATIDYWDDPADVYRVFLRKRQRLALRLQGPTGTRVKLALWRPGTRKIEPPLFAPPGKPLVRRVAASGATKRLVYRARARGWHYVQVRADFPGSGEYSLSLVKG
ncbi:MAG: S8 family serine peptidase [Gaiellaceae bacterium]